jgi:hypothetical protein
MPNDVRTYGIDKGFNVSAAVTKYCAVKMATSPAETVSPVSAVADVPIGIAMEGVATGEIAKGKGCPVALSGQMPFKAGATACNPGNNLSLGVLADGTLVPTGTGGAGTIVVAICTHAAAAGGYGSCRWLT